MTVIGTAVGTVVVITVPWLPAQASTQAGDIDTLYRILSVASVVIFSLVASVLLVSVFNFRRRPGQQQEDGPPIHGHTGLEVLWTAVPAVIVAGIVAASAVALSNIEESRADSQVIVVTAQQFAWDFDYKGLGIDNAGELHLVKDRPYRFLIKSKDVIHAFWVPEFRVKKDAVPGMTTSTRVTPTRTGEYDLVCAELCGLGHSTMKARVVVEDRASFDRWLAQARAEPPAVGSE